MSQLKIPKSDTGKSWTLRVVGRNPRVGGRECWGYCDSLKREIVVSRQSQKHGIAREVLLHEALHKLMPWLAEEAVEHGAHELDLVLDLVESAGILEV